MYATEINLRSLGVPPINCTFDHSSLLLTFVDYSYCMTGCLGEGNPMKTTVHNILDEPVHYKNNLITFCNGKHRDTFELNTSHFGCACGFDEHVDTNSKAS